MKIHQLINDTFEAAVKMEVDEPSELKRNRQRSINWVESLANEFRTKFPIAKDYGVFSKYYENEEKKQRREFGLNELLYDISVCKINYTISPRGTELAYIEKALWLVESEMAKDTRQLVYDFNKLVIGDSENKLFVGPLTSHNDEILDVFKKIVVNCKGNVWVALVPHPGKWDEKEFIPEVQKIN
ncbi:MAG: hypothetical protein K9G76_09520 [Bacteroidales bacterium]|nr:hypothetical protein [Bacteroidales bacterium]MCF8403937.1 hypothetical protein [Bacteroidales bacterium]